MDLSTLPSAFTESARPTPGEYRIDPDASRIRFRTSAMFGLAPVHGTFAVDRGALTVTDAIADSTVDVVVSARSFASGLAPRDRHVRSADYLDADRHPGIVFRGLCVSWSGDAVSVDGELTVRGVTRPVSLALDSVRTDGNRLTASATTTIDRYAFNLTHGRGITGRRLDLTIEVTATAENAPTT